jgi:hypothetical protein
MALSLFLSQDLQCLLNLLCCRFRILSLHSPSVLHICCPYRCTSNHRHSESNLRLGWRWHNARRPALGLLGPVTSLYLVLTIRTHCQGQQGARAQASTQGGNLLPSSATTLLSLPFPALRPQLAGTLFWRFASCTSEPRPQPCRAIAGSWHAQLGHATRRVAEVSVQLTLQHLLTLPAPPMPPSLPHFLLSPLFLGVLERRALLAVTSRGMSKQR